MNCPHTTTRLELTPTGPHHGKLICVVCRAFCGWAKKPANEELYAKNARSIVALRKIDLPPWEKRFIQSVDGQGEKLSPKQQAVLDRIAAEYAGQLDALV